MWYFSVISLVRLLFVIVDLPECSMKLSNLFKTLLPAVVAMGIGGSLVLAQNASKPPVEAKSRTCPDDVSGLKLPAWFLRNGLR